MTFKLRDYQQEAVDAVFGYLEKGGRCPLVEVPTGGGKSAILGELVRRVVGVHGGLALVVTHRKELIAQDEAAILKVWPDGRRDVGVWSAGLQRKENRAATVCGVQSAYRRAKQLGRRDVCIIDEAHLVSPGEGTQYQELLRGLYRANPDLCVIGLTATPYRLGQGFLTQGGDALFTSIVYRTDIKRLIRDGYLSPLTTGKAGKQINTSGVATRAGDFVLRDLELAASVDEITEQVAADIAASGRRHIIVFGCSVEHAHVLRNAIRMQGISCETVVGDTPNREAILERFKRGELACIASCDVLTTGFDAPLIDCVALVRPTQSPGLYVQMVGRGSRIAEGKTDCLVLDYGGNIARHGPIDEIRVRPKGEGGSGEAPHKVCKECLAEIPTSARTCSECDAEQPPPERKANKAASELAVVTEDGRKSGKHDLEVYETTYAAHTSKKSGKTMLRVSYYGPASKHEHRPLASEYVCLEHDGYARQKAEQWWRQHCPSVAECPTDTGEALKLRDYFREVEGIRAKEDGDWLRVTAYAFKPAREPGEDDEVEMGSNMGDWLDDLEELPF